MGRFLRSPEMAATLPLRRPRVLLVSILTFYFALLSLQAKREGSEHTRIEEWTLAVVHPLAAGAGWVVSAVREAGTGIVDLRGAAIENSRLRETLRLRDLEIIRLRRLEAEVGRLESLLGYRSVSAPSGTLVRVLYTDTRGLFKSAIVDRGTEAGIGPGSAVLDARGVVGRVVLATPGMAKVQLIVDSNASVGCLVERNRLQGVARGDGGVGLSVQYIPRGGDVQAGDRILSAGNDGVYPPGVLLGTVVAATEGDGMFREIKVRPAVEFTSLETLLALPATEIPATLREYRP